MDTTEPAPENGARVSLLARRLADPEPGADEYLAAATVLAMKYGPAVLDQVSVHITLGFPVLQVEPGICLTNHSFASKTSLNHKPHLPAKSFSYAAETLYHPPVIVGCNDFFSRDRESTNVG